ncbi:MAG: hypothetical protein P1Q69_08950 [Candidatus Thorarchaeota archaeon]|nr:hypothetical protein [Candidatus Thorarchaeota archaeon]
MVSTSRVVVTLFVTLMLLAPLVSTSQLVFSPAEVQTDNNMDLVQDSSEILEILKDEGIKFDDTILRNGEQELPFGGFIQNLGQIPDGSIKYYFSSNGVAVRFGDSKIEFAYLEANDEAVSFSITFPGANEIAPNGMKKKAHVVNYILSDLHLSNIPTFDEILYSGIYNGIDLRYYMSERGLKYEFIVHPGADPSNIAIMASDSISISIEDTTTT